MRYRTKLLITAGLLLALSLSAAGLAYWGVTQSHTYLTRSRLAHEQLERQRQLSRHSQQLFKTWTDTLLTGMSDRPLGAAYLNKVIESDLAALQELTERELAIVPPEERKDASLTFVIDVSGSIMPVRPTIANNSARWSSFAAGAGPTQPGNG